MTFSHQPPVSGRSLTPGFGLHPRSSILYPLLLTFALHPASLLACATCYGQSDSPMARGMNWGILSLLAVVAIVLACVAGFFLYLARRSANLNFGRASVSASPDSLGLPEGLNFTGTPSLSTRPKAFLSSTRPVS